MTQRLIHVNQTYQTYLCKDSECLKNWRQKRDRGYGAENECVAKVTRLQKVLPEFEIVTFDHSLQSIRGSIANDARQRFIID